MNNFWFSILSLLLTSGLVSAVVLFVLNRWVKTRDDLDSDRRKLDFTDYENALKAKLQEQQTAFEHTLSKKLSGFNHRHSLLVERRANAMAELYGRMFEVNGALLAYEYAYTMHESEKATLKAHKAAHEFADCFRPLRIYFHEPLASQINALCCDFINITRLRMPVDDNDEDILFKERFKLSSDSMKTEIREQMEKIEKAFSKLLQEGD